MNIQCPHCASTTPADAFCESCGKALPSTRAASSPRIIEGGSLAGSSAAGELQLAELARTARSAFKVLLTLAIIQLLVGGVLALAGLAPPADAGPDAPSPMALGVFVVILGVINMVLAMWARRNPFPAAITGLALYVTLWAADIALTIGSHPEAVAKGLLIKIIIVAALAKACSAGARHRALSRQLAQQQHA